MKKLLKLILVLGLAMALLCACGDDDDDDDDDGDSKKPTTVQEVTPTAGGDATPTETPTPTPEDGLTKEQYDAMTGDDLIAFAKIKDPEKLTIDEYVWLIETYRFANIKEGTNTITLDSKCATKAALKKFKNQALPSAEERSAQLKRYLTSEYPQVRGYGCSMIGGLLGASSAEIKLGMEVIKNEKEPYVLYEATKALMNEMSNPDIAAFIFSMAGNESAQVRCAAALAIGNSWSKGVDGTVPAIITLMKDSEEVVRAAACSCCGKLADESVVEPLKAILADSDEKDSVKTEAVRGLVTLWLDYPFHENTSEAAYKAYVDYYTNTPRAQIPWSSVTLTGATDASKFAAWQEKATYFNADEYCELMVSLIKDTEFNWLGRSAAFKSIAAMCGKEKLASIASVVEALDPETDKNAAKLQDAYAKEIAK